MDRNNTPYILHIESATGICSVGLSKGQQLISLEEIPESKRHAEVISLLVQKVLEHASVKMIDLDAVALSEGPGSYTSLRVGMSTAKGICYGLDIPLIAINTLASLAIEAKRLHAEHDFICAMIDARRMEVYASLYDGQMKLIWDNEAVVLDENTFDKIIKGGEDILLCGNGEFKSRSLFREKNIHHASLICSAKYLVQPAMKKYLENNFADLAYFSPNYIKSPHITQAKRSLL